MGECASGTPSAASARALAGAAGCDLVDPLLTRCRFPAGPDPVVAAVSGGADSLALLVLACVAGLQVTAVHVDHGLRPDSAAEADVVRWAAGLLGARFEAVRVHVAPGANLEARARRARYDALPPGVMTGHTADDQAETVLINVLRGAGLDGLAPLVDAGRGANPRIRRPLLALRRTETEAVCRAFGLTPVRDPSNDDRIFLRNRIRHEILPLLSDAAGRDLIPILARQAGVLAEDSAALEEAAAGIDPTDARALAAAPPALARRAVRRWLRHGAERYPPSAADVARVLAVARGEVVACQLAGGRTVRRSAQRLSLSDLPPERGRRGR